MKNQRAVSREQRAESRELKPYALCPMPYALNPMRYALRPMPHALRAMLHAFCVLCCVAAIVAGLFYGMIAEVELRELKADRGQWNMILSDRALAERAAEKDNSRFKIQNLKFKTSKNLESAQQGGITP